MRILFFFGGSYISGLEVVNFHLLNELKKGGAEIHCIVSGWNNGEVQNRLRAMQINYTAIKLGWLYVTQPSWTLDTLRNLPEARRQIRGLVKTFQPQVIHFCNYGNVLMTAGLGLRPAVYNLQEPHQPTKKHRWIYKQLHKRIDVFTTVSKAIVNKYMALNIPEEKIALIYNGIPPVDVPLTPPQRQFTFGIIGQVVRWKGHETIVRAVERLRQKGLTSFKVSIFGNDKNPFATELKSLISHLYLTDYFTWSGFVNDPEKIYAGVDCVLVPSLSEEPCSLTLIESLWRSKVVIASDRGGNPELIDAGVNGLLCEGGNPVEFAAAMEKVYSDKPLRERLAAAARQKAVHQFTSVRMAEQYGAVYKRAIQTYRQREKN